MRYLRHQISSSSSPSLPLVPGLSSAVSMATRILSSSSGFSSGGRSSLGSSSHSPSVHGEGADRSGANHSASSGLNTSHGRDTSMDFSTSPISPEVDLWHQPSGG